MNGIGPFLTGEQVLENVFLQLIDEFLSKMQLKTLAMWSNIFPLVSKVKTSLAQFYLSWYACMFTDSVFINYFSYYEEMSFLPSYMTLIDAKGKSLLYYYQVALAFNKKKLFKFHFNFERGPI